MIPPLVQAVIAPVEFGPLVSFFISGTVVFNYIFVAYVVWCLLEIMLLTNSIIIKAVSKKRFVFLFILFLVLTGFVTWMIVFKDKMLFLNYFNTFIGEVIWMCYILEEKYPFKYDFIWVFTSKSLADLLALFFYYGIGSVSVNILAFSLPIVDIIMLIIYLSLKRNSGKTK